MNSNKFVNIIEGAVLVVLGILVAINGWAALDTYFGIVGIVAGAVLVILAFALAFNTKLLPFGFLAAGAVLLTIGIALVANKLTLAVVIDLTIYALIGLGAAIAIYGLFVLLAHKRTLPYSLGLLVIGAVLIILPIVYINVADFRKAFWIIVGIAIAVYGGLVILFQFLPEKALAKK